MDTKDSTNLETYDVLFGEKEIKERIEEIGNEIALEYKDSETPLVLIPILTGGMYFASDLSRNISRENVFVEPMKVSSYKKGTESSRNPKLILDLDINIEGKDILIVEDIVDTGYSMATLLEILKTRKPRTLKVCALLSKDDRREVDVPIDYCGFRIPDLWVEGYGLDSDGENRTLPYIRVRKIQK